MRYYYDCEFLENGRTIDLISIGIVAEDGREYYAVNAEVNEDDTDADLGKRIAYHDWLMKNVVPHLPLRTEPSQYSSGTRRWMSPNIDMNDTRVKPRWVIANEVREFLGHFRNQGPIELWADYGAYDHVCLMQLWGPMIRKPDFLPMWTHDIQQEVARLKVNPDDENFPAHEDGKHHALDDARHTARIAQYLREIEAARA